MKKKVTIEMRVERSFCDICTKEVTKEPFNKDRIKVVRGLFKLDDFDAHEKCINEVVRSAFKKFATKK